MMDERDALVRIAEAHASRIRRPFGRCLETSEKLVAALARKGIAARILRCSDGILHAPQAHRRWLSLRRAPQSWVHYVVQVDDVIVDLTRRQFFPDAPHPYFTDAAGLAAEWQTIAPIEPCERHLP